MGLSTKLLVLLTAAQLTGEEMIVLDYPALGCQFTITLSTLSSWIGGGGTNISPLPVTAAEDIAAGAFVNFFGNAGANYARNAYARSPALFCNGYTLAPIPSGTVGLMYPLGVNNAVGVGTAEGQVWLSDQIPGAATTIPPITAGRLIQTLGFAVAGIGIAFQPGPPIQL